MRSFSLTWLPIKSGKFLCQTVSDTVRLLIANITSHTYLSERPSAYIRVNVLATVRVTVSLSLSFFQRNEVTGINSFLGFAFPATQIS